MDIKVNKEVHFIQGRQYLVVKTWEKVKMQKTLSADAMLDLIYQKKSEEFAREQKENGLDPTSYDMDDESQSELERLQEMQDANFSLLFSVKTLRLYNIEDSAPRIILTEQVDGNFSKNHFYDTSTLQFGGYLYFYRRK